MSKTILVVEDQADVRQMMRTYLELQGYDIIEASNGYEGVEAAVEQVPDLILMDLAMPVLDGIQATTAIRKHDKLASVPIVAVTAYGDFYKDRARDVGCNEVVQKPVNFELLHPLCKQLLREGTHFNKKASKSSSH